MKFNRTCSLPSQQRSNRVRLTIGVLTLQQGIEAPSEMTGVLGIVALGP